MASENTRSERNFRTLMQNATSKTLSRVRKRCLVTNLRTQLPRSIPGCCTKFRGPHGTKTVETHLSCTSDFGTQSGRKRNSVGMQQSLTLAQIPGRSPNTFDLTHSKYVRHLTVLLFSLKHHPAVATTSRLHPVPERYFKTQPDCESDVQIASERNFGTQVQNATKKPLASCSRVMQILNSHLKFD
jgi:hypothetical protein